MFGKVVHIGIPYASSTSSAREPFKGGIYYYASHNRDKTFSLKRNEISLRIRTHNLVDCMDMLITISVARDILPEIKKEKRLFIIEDGGYHPLTIDNLEEIYPDLKGKIIGSVEQTTSGTKILSSRNSSHYPSLSIARSEIKMCLESVFIAQKIVEELSSFIAYTNHFLNYSKVLMIGYGIFGRSVVKKLSGYKCDITVYDTDELIRDAAENEGYHTIKEIQSEDFYDHQIIIAMTGNKSFGLKELKRYIDSDADEILLSSGSSKDIEYKDILNLIQDPADSGLEFILEETGSFYEKYSVSNGERSKYIYIIANGMPVNFIRKNVISLTDKMVDLIFAEMAMCAVAIIKGIDIENGLYLLGDSESPVKFDEMKLMKEWFDINHLKFDPSQPEENLFIHPCKDYLRRVTYNKISLKEMI